MGYKPRDVYKGRRKFRVPLLILLFAVAFLLLVTVGAFYGLQQFIVYGDEGVSLQFGRAEEESPTTEAAPAVTPDVSGMTVSVVYRDPDFSDVSLPVGQELAAVQAGYVSFADAANPSRLAARLEELQAEAYSAIVFELKTEEGYLAWASTCATAYSYGTAGTMDYTETVAALKEQGVHVSARISVCADNLLAVRNWPIALLSATGTPYADDASNFWLDPYNRSLRFYIIDLMGELVAQGFDEIILDDLYHPVDEAGFGYSVGLHVPANPRAAVGQLAVKLAEAMQEYDVELSVCVDEHSLRYDLADSTGQDLELFWRIFDRIYCESDSELAASDRDYALEAGGSAERFVPICAWQSPENFGSFVVYAPS